MSEKRNRLILVVLLAVALGSWGRSEWKVVALTKTARHHHFSRRNPQQRVVWAKENRALARLWVDRHERNVAPELLDLLKTSNDPDIQLRSIRALGRLERLETLPVLERWGEQLAPERQGAMYPTLPLALSRIEHSQLQGKGKLNAITRSAGLSWREVAHLSAKLNAPKTYGQGSDGDKIVEEMLDVLYLMQKNGENVDIFINSLALTDAQKVAVNGGKLSRGAEAESIVDFLQNVKIQRSDEYDLAECRLPALGKVAADVLVKRLDTLKGQEHKFPDNGYDLLFRAAAAMNERRALPVLSYYSKTSTNSWTRTDAERAKY